MAEEVAARRGYDDVRLLTRPDSSSAIQFWTNRGYGRLKHDGPDIELGKALPLQLQVRGADNTRALGRQLASVALPGDLVILSGELGAGKTTFTQGLGTGLEIRGEITSPTFVISRIHPSLVGGPSLVHVDAYRLSDHTELDGLDLDALVEEAVTVVEWGEGLAEALADHRLEVHLGRGRGADADDGRTVTITPVGGRWYGRGLRSALLGTRRQGARRERH
ncbi:MAG: tRNA (adenosine(37)-N6)-threonylcarbamoyltransferase complex ATPase subunit type 1 TsaE [Propionibacteriales bacterium]|nr:tRNA (adenosine(37)-N6)-threonylcarbamoyltransferase complex ATPase subunit type 1 TsaE [Propionibacteriales bacterium]